MMPSKEHTTDPSQPANAGRRRFCARLGLVLLGAPLAPALLARAPAPPEARALAAALARCFPHLESARALGRAYLRAHPSEAGPRRLAALLEASLGADAGAQPPGRLAERLTARIRRDFEEERLAIVDGWVLAESEARAFALLSLA